MIREKAPCAVTRHLRISGRVQGVGYRWSMAQEAKRMGVNGWVCNRRDGSVEAVVSGPAALVDQLIAWAHRGPPLARVDAVEASEIDGVFEGFEQRETR